MSRLAARRPLSCFRVPRRADRAGAGNTTEGWLDKNAHIVRRSVGCSCRVFESRAHIAAVRRNVRRTSKALNPHSLFHIGEQCHGR